MKNIEEYFQKIVTQKLFLQEITTISICIAALLVSLMFWLNDIISSNNGILADQMSSNITLTIFDMQRQISKISLAFNISRILTDRLASNYQALNLNSTRFQIIGQTPSNSELSILQLVDTALVTYMSTSQYYYINLDQRWVSYNSKLFSASDFDFYSGCRIDTNGNVNLCNQLQQFVQNDQFDVVLFNNYFKEHDIYSSIFPIKLSLSYYQICGRVAGDSIYMCSVLNFSEQINEEQLNYMTFTLNDTVISNNYDNCLNNLKCSIEDYQQQQQQAGVSVTDAFYTQFLSDLTNSNWYQQLHPELQDYEIINPMTDLGSRAVSSFFYLNSIINHQLNVNEVQDNYTQEYLNITQEQLNHIKVLNQQFYRYQISTINSEFAEKQSNNIKEQEYYYFSITLSSIVFIVFCIPAFIAMLTRRDFDQISITLDMVSSHMQQFFQLDYDQVHASLSEFQQQNQITLAELIDLVRIFDEFSWLIDFLRSPTNNKNYDLPKLEQGLSIFKQRDCAECEELILVNLIEGNSKSKQYETAIAYNKQLIQMLENQKAISIENQSKDLQKINLKLFNSLNQLLGLLSKHLIRKKGKDREAWNQAKLLFTNIMDFADTLEIKFTLQIKLFFKKCKLLFNLRKIKEAEQCIDQAQLILQQNYQNNKNLGYKLNPFNQDKKLLQIVQQKIYFYRGLIHFSSSQYLSSIQYLMLALEYGNVYQSHLRVKTIKVMSQLLDKNRRFEQDSRTLKQIQYFYQNERRLFQFLIDSTHRMSENLIEVTECIKKVFELMNDEDLISIHNFDEEVHTIIEIQSKSSLLENMGKTFMEDGIYDYLSGRQTQNQRRLYNAIIELLEADDIPKKHSRYMIVITLGENSYDQYEVLEQLCEMLADDYCHFTLCSPFEKKYINQRSSYLRLIQEARDGNYVDLFGMLQYIVNELIHTNGNNTTN